MPVGRERLVGRIALAAGQGGLRLGGLQRLALGLGGGEVLFGQRQGAAPGILLVAVLEFVQSVANAAAPVERGA